MPGPTGNQGWYSGPLPANGLIARETVGAAIGRTVVKAITFLIVLFTGFFVIPFVFFASIAALASSAAPTEVESNSTGTLVAGESGADLNLVAIKIEGPILGEDPGGGASFFAPTGVTYGYSIKEQLIELADDDDVDGVVLELDTPGGTIFGSQAIADGVTYYRETTGKPVVAFVAGISASGGMYAMAGADEILADHGTLIGSIGVIFGPFQQFTDVTAIDGGLLGGGVTTSGGIEFEYLTAGRSKDLGNPYRPFTDEEREVLQQGLDDAYDVFVGEVSAGRGLSEATIKRDLGALIYGEAQAVENGLIDAVANRDAAYERAAVLAGLDEGDTWALRRLEDPEPGFFDLFSARVLGTESEAEPSPLSESPLCVGSGTILAYHGDPAMLCSLPTP